VLCYVACGCASMQVPRKIARKRRWLIVSTTSYVDETREYIFHKSDVN
jgi:hypothetical protein